MSGHDLQTGSKSRNQSRADVGATLLEDREPPPPQKHRDRQDPLQEPKKHAGASNLQTKGVPRGLTITHGGAKSATDFVGSPRGNQEREANSISGSALGRFTDRTRL